MKASGPRKESAGGDCAPGRRFLLDQLIQIVLQDAANRAVARSRCARQLASGQGLGAGLVEAFRRILLIQPQERLHFAQVGETVGRQQRTRHHSHSLPQRLRLFQAGLWCPVQESLAGRRVVLYSGDATAL